MNISTDYKCYCHSGVCPLHEEENTAREWFITALCSALGFDNKTEPYGSERHVLAREILHIADYYVYKVLNKKA